MTVEASRRQTSSEREPQTASVGNHAMPLGVVHAMTDPYRTSASPVRPVRARMHWALRLCLAAVLGGFVLVLGFAALSVYVEGERVRVETRVFRYVT